MKVTTEDSDISPSTELIDRLHYTHQGTPAESESQATWQSVQINGERPSSPTR